jgi:enoyl-CoA hydratase
VDAAEADKIGLVSRLVDEENLMDAAMETARTMLTKGTQALRLTKEVLNQNIAAPSLEAAVELENRNQAICAFTADFLKAVEKFAKNK